MVKSHFCITAGLSERFKRRRRNTPLEDSSGLNYWEQKCALDRECGFTNCEPPKQQYQYYDDTTLVTWTENSREEELTKQLGDLYYQRLLLGGTPDDGVHCGCKYCDLMITDRAERSLVNESTSLGIEFGELLRLRVEDA